MKNNQQERIHFLGMAGVGVSAVARIMQAQGRTISGTDAKDLPVMSEFAARGAVTYIGYRAENLDDLDAKGLLPNVIVASSIAQDGNPEYEAARRRGLRLLHRSQALAEAMSGHRVIAVAGTHGKTTTSSMTATALRAAELDPTFAIGANLVDLGVNAHVGSTDLFVAEADESDGSLLNYTPTIVVLTNVEPDHLDHYGTPEAVYQVFKDFTAKIVPDGTLIYCTDDPGASSTAAWAREHRSDLNVIGYGFDAAADIRLSDAKAVNTGQEFTLTTGETSHQVRLQMPGQHNALNAAAALAVLSVLDANLEAGSQGLAGFGGAARRFQFHGEVQGIRVFDDYAHHPTEVRAVLQAARSIAGAAAVRVLFQPHLFSRTQEFAAEFAAALELADEAIILPIYPAREDPIPGVTAELIAHKIGSGAPVLTAEAAVAQLAQQAQPGDVLLTVGAGDVTYCADHLVTALEDHHSHGDGR
ncbi:UDP-N-acetylmuramate--L-alanine ligase [Micrococcoides hystricis]|uniref:UDP-N-acetylmuramate--L-alanine ligase n=1 Tax=Micrococcoides hystricis TaxID=1572761 RepID=A0ABV6P6T4_9MICC